MKPNPTRTIAGIALIAIGLAFIAGIFLAGPLLKRLQIEANATTGFDVVSPTDPTRGKPGCTAISCALPFS